MMSLSNKKQLHRLLHPLLFHSISFRPLSTTSRSDDSIDNSDATKAIASNSSLHHHVLRSSIPHSTSILTPSISDHHSIVTSLTTSISSPNSHTTRGLIPLSIFTPYAPAISTSRTTYCNFLVSQKCNLLIRYFGFPKMRSIPPRPLDAMDPYELNKFHVPPHEILDTDLTRQGAVTELKFAFTRNPDINSKAPMIKVHNLRASSELNGKVTSLICTPPKPKDDDYWKHELLMNAAIKLMKLDLKTRGIEEAEMEELWYDERGNTENMWVHGYLKHVRFSFCDADMIYDYASKTFDMAKPILKGSEGRPGLGEFLLQEGFVVGQYHDVDDLLVSLKKFFGVDVYPTFVGHGGYHPALFEIGLLATRDCARLLDHPMSSTVPKGKFLMRHL